MRPKPTDLLVTALAAIWLVASPTLTRVNAEEGATTTKPAATAKKEEAEQHPALAKLELVGKLRKAKRYDEAIAAVNDARSMEMDGAIQAKVELSAGQVYFSRGQDVIDGRLDGVDGQASVKESIRVLKGIVKDHPDAREAAQAAYLLGSAYLISDRFEEAIGAYEKAYANFPESKLRSKALLRVGVCKAALGQASEAAALYQRVIKEFPDAKFDVKKAGKYLREIAIVHRRAPRLGVTEWLHGSVGGEDLASFEGQVVVLVFFATWCNHCSHNMPRLRTVMDAWEDEGVVFLGVANPNDPQNTEPIDSYVDKNNIQFQDIALDRTYQTWKSYRVTGLPACVIIDRRGFVRWRGNLSFLPRTLIAKLNAQ